jgi:hypothetical protein
LSPVAECALGRDAGRARDIMIVHIQRCVERAKEDGAGNFNKPLRPPRLAMSRTQLAMEASAGSRSRIMVISSDAENGRFSSDAEDDRFREAFRLRGR